MPAHPKSQFDQCATYASGTVCDGPTTWPLPAELVFQTVSACARTQLPLTCDGVVPGWTREGRKRLRLTVHISSTRSLNPPRRAYDAFGAPVGLRAAKPWFAQAPALKAPRASTSGAVTGCVWRASGYTDVAALPRVPMVSYMGLWCMRMAMAPPPEL